MNSIIGFHAPIRHEVALAPYTTWRVGGPAALFVEPTTIEELQLAYQYAVRNDIPFAIIGRGSNVLVNSRGFPGMVACLRNTLGRYRVDHERRLIRVEAGCPMPRLARCAAKNGYAGFEFMIGIPGTIGAGVAINAGMGGFHGPSIRDVLVDVTGLDAGGKLSTLKADDLEISYRGTCIPQRRFWVVAATLVAREQVEPGEIYALHEHIVNERKSKQPLREKTCGSVFKQDADQKPPGWYIDRAGLKNCSRGGARISPRHANWIESDGTASCEDIKYLIRIAQETVFRQFGVLLHREVVYFPEDDHDVFRDP